MNRRKRHTSSGTSDDVSNSNSMEHHLRVDRGDPLSIGTAIHMMTAAVRPCKVHDRGFLYEDMHRTGSRVTYLSETFSLSQFVAVLQINLGTLDSSAMPCVPVCSSPQLQTRPMRCSRTCLVKHCTCLTLHGSKYVGLVCSKFKQRPGNDCILPACNHPSSALTVYLPNNRNATGGCLTHSGS